VSAKKQKVSNPTRDFRNGGARLAALRAVLIVRQLERLKALCADQVADAQGRRGAGRPRDSALDWAVLEYELDVAHFDALRLAGYGNVPPDKRVLDGTIQRHQPEVLESPDRLRRARGALKDAVRQRRKKRAR
jgi:hypothetical protein